VVITFISSDGLYSETISYYIVVPPLNSSV
jgi:hypothetical protein